MWKYIKAAFAVKQPIPLLGSVPINAIIIPIILALTVLHPAFLLIGIGFQATLITSLAFSAKFRSLVDSPSEQEKIQEEKTKRDDLLSKLNSTNHEKFLKLEKRIAQTKASYEQFESPAYLSEPNLKSLHSLAWIYLKLLFAESALSGAEAEQNAIHIEQQISSLQQELEGKQVSHSIRKSKEATLEILNKRLKHFAKSNDTLEEVKADLTRIEAQVELARDNAKLQAKPEEVSIDVDLASDTIQSVWYYGEADDAIQDIEDQYHSHTHINPLAH